MTGTITNISRGAVIDWRHDGAARGYACSGSIPPAAAEVR
jgi:hypothetical protein